MDIALITGADAGPGLAIARRLIGMGCRVYALATHFARNPYPHDDFIPLTCNLADADALTKVAEDVLAREGHLSFVVHAARRQPAPLFESSAAELAERVQTGLLAPLVLARVALPYLRKEKGHFIVLCWNGDGPAPGGPVTAAIEGGLHHFADQLFDELRSDGVRATTVYARPNPETAPEVALALDPQSAVNPELLADAVEQLIRLRPSNVISTLVIRPAANAETPRLARSTDLAGIATRELQLPPRQNFPREPEPIYTPRRQRPADAPAPGAEDYDEDDYEDEDEDEDWDPRDEPLPWTAKTAGPEDRPDDQRAADGRPPEPGDQPPRQRESSGYAPRPPGDAPPRPGERRHPDDHPDQGDRRGGRRRRGRGGRGNQGGREGYDPSRSPQPNRGPERRGPPSTEYPDPEREAAQRAAARDASFRTPHLDAEDEPASESEGDQRPPASTHGGEPETGGRGGERDDAGNEPNFAPGEHGAPHGGEARPRAGQYVPRKFEPTPGDQPAETTARPPRQAPDQGQDSGQGRGQGPGQGHGGQGSAHGPRRHRRFGRRPPPGSGRRGPDSD